MTAPLKMRVIMVGVGGATCSGKTTLAKYLREVLPGSFIVHQDDFAPPAHTLPIHPIHKVQDWDSAPTAIDWPRLQTSLQFVREHGDLPEGHKSHDHLNTQELVPADKTVVGRWQEKMRLLTEEREKEGEEVRWVLVDGFLMYWDKEVVDQLDVRIFLRVPRAELAARRHARHGYHTAVQTDFAENTLWRDPPGYFDQIVYPAYVAAHEHLFVGGDVEGELEPEGSGKGIEGLVYCDGRGDVGVMIEKVGPVLVKVAQAGARGAL